MNSNHNTSSAPLFRYMAAITLANRLLEQALLTRREFLTFEEKMRRKYSLPKCSLYRDFHLIYPPSRS